MSTGSVRSVLWTPPSTSALLVSTGKVYTSLECGHFCFGVKITSVNFTWLPFLALRKF